MAAPLTYPALVIVLVAAVYGVYLANNVIPQYHALYGPSEDDAFYRPSETEFWGVVVIFHALLGMLLLCFVLSAVRSPGHIPLDSEEDERCWIHGELAKRISPEDEGVIKKIFQDLDTDLTNPALLWLLRNIPVVERKKKYGYHRHCSACNLYKPDRTHHCRVCDRCILRMDHHCPWIANCVGYGNYKFFMLLLLYSILCTVFIMGSMGRRIAFAFRPVLDESEFLLEDLPVFVIFLLCLFMSLALSMFFCFHLNLTLNAMTTIELREKKNNSDPFVQHRFAVAHLKYDKGPWQNFLSVFGPWYLWLLPIHAGGDGTYSRNLPLQRSEGGISPDAKEGSLLARPGPAEETRASSVHNDSKSSDPTLMSSFEFNSNGSPRAEDGPRGIPAQTIEFSA